MGKTAASDDVAVFLYINTIKRRKKRISNVFHRETRLKQIFTLFAFLFILLAAEAQTYIYGTVTGENGRPVDNLVVSDISTQNRVFTANDGQYRLEIAPGVATQILYHHISFIDTTLTVTLTTGEQRKIDISLRPAGQILDQIEVAAEHHDGYERIDPKLSFKMPSPTSGVESLLKSFQGVSSTNELSTQYNVRGGNYDENLIFVNGIQIYRPFLVRSGNQEGLSFVNLDLTRSVKFSAGGFSAEYGDKMSSVLDVEYKKPREIGGSLSFGFLGGSAHAEGVVKDKKKERELFTYLVGVRYKSNAYLLSFMDSKGDYKPHFFDAQMLLTWNVAPKFNISLLGNFAINSYLYMPTVRTTRYGTTDVTRQFTVYSEGQEVDKYESYLGGLTFTYTPTKKSTLRWILSSYYAKERETYDILNEYFLSDIEADMSGETDNVAQEVSRRAVGGSLEHVRNALTAAVTALDFRGEHRLNDNFLTWGVKLQNEIIQDRIKEWTLFDSAGYSLPAIPILPGSTVPFDDPSRIFDIGINNYFACENAINTLRATGFVQNSWRFENNDTKFILNGGVRFHYWSFNNEFTASPRIALHILPDWEKDWNFGIKTGVYYQSPFYREMRRPDGTLNRNIKSQYSYQILGSSEYNFKMWRRPFKFTTEVYYKHLENLVSYSIDNLRITYSGENDARGYATGIDLKLSGEFIDGLESWISMSLMKTAEDLYNDFYYTAEGELVRPGYIRRPSDQRIAFNIFFQDHVPGFRPVRVHLNFVFASGLPHGAPHTERYQQTLTMPWYRRVDVGFSYIFLEQGRDRYRHKSPFIRAIGNAGIYLEIFNILGINNVSSYTWFTDINGSQNAVPDYLTPRLINLKFAVDF